MYGIAWYVSFVKNNWGKVDPSGAEIHLVAQGDKK
jgi:hypothetical protein